MGLRRRNNRERRSRGSGDAEGYEDAAKSRLRSISERGGYEFRDEDRPEVEARLRRMFYGAKVEGSRAQSADDTDGEDPGR